MNSLTAILSEPLAPSSPCKADIPSSSESEDEISKTMGDRTFVLSQESQYVNCMHVSSINHKSYIIRSESDCDTTTKANKFFLVTESAMLSLFVSCIFCGKAARLFRFVAAVLKDMSGKVSLLQEQYL